MQLRSLHNSGGGIGSVPGFFEAFDNIDLGDRHARARSVV
jgi:hypothetical protein